MTYLNDFLEVKDHQKDEMRLLRQFIKGSFEELTCFLLPHPGNFIFLSINNSEIRYAFSFSIQNLFKNSPHKKTFDFLKKNPSNMKYFFFKKEEGRGGLVSKTSLFQHHWFCQSLVLSNSH